MHITVLVKEIKLFGNYELSFLFDIGYHGNTMKILDSFYKILVESNVSDYLLKKYKCFENSCDLYQNILCYLQYGYYKGFIWKRKREYYVGYSISK